MTFLEKIKTTEFWKNTSRIGLVFLLILVLFSLVFNSFSDLINFDFAAVAEVNFINGKWKTFFGSKIAKTVSLGGISK